KIASSVAHKLSHHPAYAPVNVRAWLGIRRARTRNANSNRSSRHVELAKQQRKALDRRAGSAIGFPCRWEHADADHRSQVGSHGRRCTAKGFGTGCFPSSPESKSLRNSKEVKNF